MLNTSQNRQVRAALIIEQALGHITHTKNLQESFRQHAQIKPYWCLPAWEVNGVAARIPVYRSNWTVRAGLRARWQLSSLARRERLDVLFFHTQVTAILAQDWLDRIPGIVSLDATPRQYDQIGDHYGHEAGPAWLEKWKWQLNRDCFRKARKLVTWSAWARQGLVDEYEVPADKVTVIPPGVDSHWWARPDFRSIQPGPVRILFVGGNLERKGGDLLLEAFRKLRAERDPASGSSEIELHLVTGQALPPEPGVTVYNQMKPNSPQLRDLYHQSDIFCLPTQADCLPMVLSEAGAAGLPVISTALAGIPEIVHTGRNGLLIQPGCADELVQSLRTLVDNPTMRLQMGAAGQEIVREQFDAQDNADRLAELMIAVAEENKRR